jgi:hypothetical protein
MDLSRGLGDVYKRQAVPLPASLPLLAAGAAALGFFRRRRRKEV